VECLISNVRELQKENFGIEDEVIERLNVVKNLNSEVEEIYDE